MKAEHRHELKTNELAEWIAHFPQWAKKNRNTIIYVSVLIIVVAGISIWRSYSKNVVAVQKQIELTNLIRQLPYMKMQIIQAQAQGFDPSYNLIQIADNLQAVAQNIQDDRMVALALIKRAEVLRAELHYRLETVSEQELINQINRAKASYTEAIEKSSKNPPLMAAATFGLGLCEEELGNFDKAKQIYSETIANTSLEHTTAAAQAKYRLNTMADYEQKIVFRAPPKPAPELKPPEPAETEFELSSSDINLTNINVEPPPPTNVPGNPNSLPGQ